MNISVKCKQTEHEYLLVRVIFEKSRDLQNEIIGEARWPTKKAGFFKSENRTQLISRYLTQRPNILKFKQITCTSEKQN
jgi:hypothetical protein